MKHTLFLFACVLVATSLVAQAPAAPSRKNSGTVQPSDPNAAKGSVRGFVYDMGTGAPIKRAQVSLRNERRPGEPLAAATDAQGAFVLNNVDAGTYVLFCSRTGYVSSSGQSGSNRPPTQITVAPGQEIKDITFRLVRGGVITGMVMDEEGEPLSNVQVQVLTKQYMRGQARTMPRGGASTDDRGIYRIFGLSPGRYYVQASLRTFGPEQRGSYAPIFFPGALSVPDAQRVEVTSGGETQRIDFRMRPVPTFSISGRVVDANGQPVGEAQVSAGPADLYGGMTARVTRPDGTFRLEGMVPGRNRVTAMRRPTEPGMPLASVSRLVDVGEADVENLVFVLGPGITVRGRIIAEGATLQDRERARVMLMPKADTTFSAGAASAMLNPDLTFELKNVQPGEYTLNYFGPPAGGPAGGSMASFYVSEVRVGGQNVIDRGIVIPESGAIGTVDVVLGFDPGAVSGRVTNAAGEPVAGVQVVLVASDREKRSLERYFRGASPDQNGNYTIRGVVPGDYLLLVWPDRDAGAVLDPDVFSQLERYATSVTVGRSASETKDLKLADEVRALAANVAQ